MLYFIMKLNVGRHKYTVENGLTCYIVGDMSKLIRSEEQYKFLTLVIFFLNRYSVMSGANIADKL